ncbi:UNVERIFIED_CONTAM: hypothetical protein GTU68_002601, partial [Idotea baltica]|nr:hypothetical protein [Idotea baltica]
MKDKTKFYIGGDWVKPDAAHPFEVVNPSNGSICATISLGSATDVDRAVQSAKAALPQWAAKPQAERTALIEAVLKSYIAREDDMAAAISMEMGAPIDFARDAQAYSGRWHIEGFLDAITKFDAEFPLHAGDTGEMIVHEPIGVCGLITPWNWPMNQVTLKVIPALLVGCSVVLKPAEIAPLSSMLLAEILDEAGIPAGVFNLVNGDGLGVGAALSAHADVDMLSFTGSTRAGIAVGKSAMETMKPATLELGGKSPNLIFADADVETAVRHCVTLCMENTGQSCNAPTRMLVEQSVYDTAVEIAATAAQAIMVGRSDQTGAHIGPLVSQDQFDTVQRYIQIGLDEGARLVAGGLGHPEGFEDGFFAHPTVFADVDNKMRIAQEEIFGPVLTIIP